MFSCLRDKPAAELGQILFPLFKQVIFAPIHSPRATPVEDLMAAARGYRHARDVAAGSVEGRARTGARGPPEQSRPAQPWW